MDINQAVNLLEEKKLEIDGLMDAPGYARDPKFIEWDLTVKGILKSLYGEKTKEYHDFEYVQYFGNVIRHGPYGTFDEDADYYKKGLNEAKAVLNSIITQLKLLGIPSKEPVIQKIGNQIHINPSFNQNQSQTQTQTSNQTFEQQIEKAVKEIEANYNEDIAKQSKVQLEELKNNSDKWAVVQKTIQFFLSLGKVAFTAILPILLKILLPIPVPV